jgi:hypothetical protein
MRLAPVSVLFGAATVLALSGLWLRVARPPLPKVDPAQLKLPAQKPSSAAGDIAPANYQPIVAQNIFAQSRGAEPPKPSVAAPAKARPTGPTLELRGTTIGPRGAIALIGADVHRVGDIVDGARLVAITDSTVTLERPSGPLVLHVPSSQRKKL